ncbi:hypothetical protein GCM10027447_04800 [Glycomyces halotolerans]
MPGELHEILVKLVQDQPEVVAELSDLLSREPSPVRCTAAETRSCSVGSSAPVERRADLVVKTDYADGSERITIVEVQNEWSREKYYRLPGYMTRAFEDYQLPVELLLIGGTDAVARRFGRGIELGPANTIAIRAIRPSDFPDPAAIDPGTEPALTLIAAAFRGRKPPPDVELFISNVDRALGKIEPKERAVDYTTYLLALFAKEPKNMLETLMQTESRPYHSAFSDRLRGEGREQGREEGRQEGREEGSVLASRRHLLKLLERLSGGVTAEQRRRIEACDDLEQLEAWIDEVLETRRLEFADR